MDVISETTEKGVTERRFDLRVGDDVVPGLIWSPEGADRPLPVVLLGHGGTQDKRAPNVLGLARRLVRHLGYVVVALDAPGHGDRIVDPEAAETARRNLEERIAGGRDGTPRTSALDSAETAAWLERTANGGREWTALLDDLTDEPLADLDRVGYWGLSMGTIIGLPFVSGEPRVKAAVLGLAGLGERPGGSEFEAAARRLTVPILLVFQWDDELMTRQSGLDLFDAIGSVDKAMHIHPGGHVATPLYERDVYEAFYLRHLGEA